jgi:hypothetical protein
VKQHYRTIAVGSVGNIMEWFDFSIYGYFAPVIAQVFFPAGDHFLSLLAALVIFASGFLMRPLGAAPSFYLILVGMACFLLALGVRETKGRALSDLTCPGN